VPELTKAQIESEAAAAVETFLLAFGTKTSR
jgi:hypothetical protein